MSLLAVNNIKKEYRNKEVLRDISLQVERGDKLALIGANGSGKTTLLKIIMGLEEQDFGEIFKSKKVRVGYLSQYLYDLETSNQNALYYEELFKLENKIDEYECRLEHLDYEKDLKVYEEIMKAYSLCMQEFDLIDGYTLQNKIKKILLGLGLRKEALSISLSKLSGGEKMRVSLARILLNEPELLILDEPTNHLDIKAIEWLEEYLKRFSGGVLIVSHDRYFLDRVTTRIAEIQNGHLTTKKCNYSGYLVQKSRLRDYYLKEQKNLQKQIRDGKLMVTKLRKYKKIKQSQSREKSLEKLEEKAKEMMMHLKTSENLKNISGPALKFKKISHLSSEIVTIKKLNKSFDNYHILKDLNLKIYGGERVAIVGPNGCGKTTLINIMLGRDSDYTGFVNFGKWVNYSYIGQEVSFEDEERTILEELLYNYELDEKEVRKHLSAFQFYGDVINTKIKVLSGGEKVRVVLACVMLKNPHCLILDEPTNHLDLESRIAIEKAIQNFDGTVISVSHDRYFLNKCVSRILEIKDGSITSFNGNYDDYKKGFVKEVEVKKVKVKKEEEKDILKEEKKYKDLEMKIEELEEKISEFELAINENFKHEDYLQYDVWTKDLKELYTKYEECI